jgi:amino acid transporter
MSSNVEVFVRKATGVVREVSGYQALLANIAVLQIGLPGFYVYLTAWMFPGWDVPTIFLVSLIPVMAHATVLSIMSSQFPRSGADYVWASRIVHPVWIVSPHFALQVMGMLLVPSFFDWGIYGGFGSIAAALSISLKNPGLIAVAQTLANPNVRFGIVSIFLVVMLLLNISAFKWVRRWISLWAIVGTICGLIAGIAVLASSHDIFVSLWNANMGQYMTYDQVIQTALDNGYEYIPIGAGAFGAFFGLIACTYEMSIGYAGSISFAGEVKSARRSIPLATYGCVILGAIVLFLMVYGVSSVFGQQFIYSSMFLYYARPDLWQLPFAADPFLFANVATGLNPILSVLIPFGLIAGGLGLIPVFYLVASRYFLAYSFDRFMPTPLATVSKKYHTPWVALLVCFVIMEIGTAFSCYYAAGVVYIGLPYRSMSMLAIIVTVAAALLFPLLRKDIYQRSDIVIRYKWALVVSAVITLGFFGIAVPMVLSHPEYGGPANIAVWVFFIALLLVGPIIWALSKIYWGRRGLDISLVYKEIQPE